MCEFTEVWDSDNRHTLVFVPFNGKIYLPTHVVKPTKANQVREERDTALGGWGERKVVYFESYRGLTEYRSVFSHHNPPQGVHFRS